MKILGVYLKITFMTLQCFCVRAQRRIVGGEEINITDVPYTLSLMMNGHHICGAGIISEIWGMTAAHCVTNSIPENGDSLQVRSGSSIREEGGVVHNVTEIRCHDKFHLIDDNYDIAVFKVDPKFIFNEVTRPIRLPKEHLSTDIKWGLVAGWGYFIVDTINGVFDPVLSENLLFVILPKISHEACQKDYALSFDIKSNEVCYGLQEGGRDSCKASIVAISKKEIKGDSGGLLVNPDRIAIGITSWGNSCAKINSPGVYINVLKFVTWIRNVTEL